MRALIVDDSRVVRDCLKLLLQNRGVDCVDAEDGQRGLCRVADCGPFDVALVDWNMPVMNGLEMVKAMRQDVRFAALKILIVTTESEHAVIEAALAAGADEFLMKPFDEAALTEKLQMVGLLQD
jgi:two-component system chemotaxis response regulator CheY